MHMNTVQVAFVALQISNEAQGINCPNLIEDVINYTDWHLLPRKNVNITQFMWNLLYFRAINSSIAFS